MGVPQIVIDTNVLAAAARSRHGASWRVLELAGTGVFEVHLSVALVFEYEEVLRRNSPPDSLGVEEIEDILNFLCAVGVPHETPFLWRPTLRDPDDEFVLELSVAAGVDYIVTHNVRDFAGASAFGIGVLTPREFLRSLENRS